MSIFSYCTCLHASRQIPEWLEQLHRHVAADIIGPWLVVTEMQPPRTLELMVELEASGWERCRELATAGKLPATMPRENCRITTAACLESMLDVTFTTRCGAILLFTNVTGAPHTETLVHECE
jgi:hypothetical protein